jgi:2-isopropylmalate synthase
VDELANVTPDIRAPYVGEAAFTHKGGLHVHAVQKLAHSYEHVAPEVVGNTRLITISDMSGQSNILARAAALGYPLEKGSAVVQRVLQEVKDLEAAGYEFEAAEGSFELLLRKLTGVYVPLFELQEFHCSYRRSGDGRWNKCEATVKLLIDGAEMYTVAEGDGPVNALDAALRKALRPAYPEIDRINLTDYKVRILSGAMGTAARTRVLVTSDDGTRTWGTVGVSDNIIEASWLALVDGIEFWLGRKAVA